MSWCGPIPVTSAPRNKVIPVKTLHTLPQSLYLLFVGFTFPICSPTQWDFPKGGGGRLTVKQDLMHPQTINADTEQELNMRHSAQTQSPYSHECVFSAAQNPLERRLLPPVLNKTMHKLIAHLSRLPTDCYSYIFNCAAAVKAAWFLLWPFHVPSRCSVSSGVSVNIFYSIRKRADAHVKKERRLLVLDGQRTYIPQKVQTNAANQFHT